MHFVSLPIIDRIPIKPRPIQILYQWWARVQCSYIVFILILLNILQMLLYKLHNRIFFKQNIHLLNGTIHLKLAESEIEVRSSSKHPF